MLGHGGKPTHVTVSTQYEGRCAPAGGAGHSKGTENKAGVWMPMESEAKKDWSWVDWMRFLFYRQALISHYVSL